MMEFIIRSEGLPLRRCSFIPEENKTTKEEDSKTERREKTYVDEEGVRL